MAYTIPSIADFKVYFARNFPFQPDNVDPDPEEYIQDSDVAKAFTITNTQINPKLFCTQAEYTVGYMYLAAYFLVQDIQLSGSGIRNTAAWQESSKSVGSVAQSFVVPPSITNNPYLAWLTLNGYGQTYLGLIYPKLVAPIFTIPGRTPP